MPHQDDAVKLASSHGEEKAASYLTKQSNEFANEAPPCDLGFRV